MTEDAATSPRRPLDDLLLYRLSRLLAVAGSMVIRLCEGRFGITRREWRLIAVLASRGELGSSQLAEHAQLDRARTSKTIGSLVEKRLVSRVARAGDRRQVLLGLTESYGVAMFGTPYRNLFAFILLLVILVWKPNGLFGRKRALPPEPLTGTFIAPSKPWHVPRWLLAALLLACGLRPARAARPA